MSVATPHLTLLDESDLRRVRDGVLYVLETVGAAYGSERARELLRDAGCDVDDETGVALIPRELTERTISQLDDRVLLAGRDPRHDVVLDGTSTHLMRAGVCPHIVDLETGEHREPALRDVEQAGRVVDALDEIPLCFFLFLPSADVPPQTSDLATLACLLGATGKHIFGELITPQDARYALEMVRVAAPDADPRERPIFSTIYNPISPLQHEKNALDAAMLLVESGIPQNIYAGPLSGATGPMTLAGTMVQTVAEELSAAVVFKLLREDCPLILSSNAGIMDMASAQDSISSPETMLLNNALTEVIHSLGAPALSAGYAIDAWDLGTFRAGVESMGLALVTRLARPDISAGAGGFDAVETASLAKLVLDAEVARESDRVAAGIGMDDDHLALDVIAAVGPGGQYLAEDHTVRHLRDGEHWMPKVLARSTRTSGSPNAVELAAARARKIVETHEAAPLPDGAAERIADILAEVAAEHGVS